MSGIHRGIRLWMKVTPEGELKYMKDEGDLTDQDRLYVIEVKLDVDVLAQEVPNVD